MGDIVGSVADLFGFGPASKQADAVEGAAAAQAAASKYAIDTQKAMFDKQIELQEPWRQAGTNALNQMQEGAYELPANFSFDASQVPQDPGYSFRLSEGMNAMNRSAAAKGGLMSGAALKAGQRYGQAMGSQEYQNAYSRALDKYNADVGRSTLGFNRLASQAGLGQTSANQIGGAASQYGTNVSNLATAQGANQANALLAEGNIRSSQYGNYGKAFDALANYDWGSLWGGSGSGGEEQNLDSGTWV